METDSLVDQTIVGLPGEMLVRQGVADLRAGRRTIAACAVDIARSRFHRAGSRRRGSRTVRVLNFVSAKMFTSYLVSFARTGR
jgi:hypothetical protein